ncbi:MAG: formate--tetrahydrofolate ligase [Acidimicrobiia bacterium]|jgi:formate--tetrahydrofolate ligase|nr:formate--tetrahydrofolate ligase [Acidimicrobiia bacterium]
MLSDLEIARAARPRPIAEVAADLGIPREALRLYGDHIAKVVPGALPATGGPRGRYVLVTAVTPTPLGEGKTTTAVGLAQALHRLGHRAVVTLRQPSLGPTFGIKGGAAGGGYSQVIPMEDLNLHLTGDFHAVTAANNLAAALVDSHLFHGNALTLNPDDIPWRRVLDVNDRPLREVTIGLGRRTDGIPRRTGFEITAASEVMAILALASDLADLRRRLGRAVVAYTTGGRPVTADQVGAGGAMAVLMKDALAPNLLQTLEGTPALVHAGPFANIAHGSSSILADLVGLRGADYVVTEAGFGADVGAEKFCNIKCRVSGLHPDAAVVVTTVRAMKAQTGKHRIVPGRPIPEALGAEDPGEVLAGADNLRRHVAIVRRHGVTPVVAVNHFPSDHPSEHAAIGAVCDELGVAWAVCDPHAGGGAGVADLAREVEQACAAPSGFRYLYPDEMPLRAKIETIATEVYGAGGVSFEAPAAEALERFEALGWGSLPVCMAKTHLSLTHDPAVRGAPTGWTLPIKRVRASIGAGFVLAMAGEIRTMPGLGSHPAAHGMDLDADGNIVGLS